MALLPRFIDGNCGQVTIDIVDRQKKEFLLTSISFASAEVL
jgi:hypothetical protein